ncbi:hypothetical protein DICVIV_10030 [Dictyocaulus viviparus]|uniref:Na+/Pi-cotransporter n=1 Tax=Dictyocaulus viviparus TaxID=29172 RepID=A0A0D8XNJ1_DICVI|nr:hypothetical protein DICVIV_10030 [Dictyocaulus viviparus]
MATGLQHRNPFDSTTVSILDPILNHDMTRQVADSIIPVNVAWSSEDDGNSVRFEWSEYMTLAGKAIKASPLINDPMSAVVVGMLVTVILQSATTTTNILVGMIAANSFIEEVSWLIVDPLIAEHGISLKTLDLLTDPINRMIIEVNEVELRNATIDDDYFPPNHSFVSRIRLISAHLLHRSLQTHFCIIFIIGRRNRMDRSLLNGPTASCVRILLAKKCPGIWKPCTGYAVMLAGLLITLAIQSNSMFSSSLTPLVGSGVITLDQMYPLILGANIGGSFSAVLAALTADGSRFEK